MNNSNLLVAVNFDLAASPKVFNFTDTSNYTGVTASAKLGNLTAVAPNGTTFHNNISLVTPDITYNTSPNSADFSLSSILVSGKLPTGSYIFTYTMNLTAEQQNVSIISNTSNTIQLAGNWATKINDSSATAFKCIDLSTTDLSVESAIYNAGTNITNVTVSSDPILGSLTAYAIFQFTVNTVAVNTFTQAYTYVSPTPCLNWIADDCCSSMTITDVTAYPSGAIITRLHTVHYPDGMLIPIADIVSPLQELTISPIWTGTWTDTFTASFSSTNGLITILDALRIVDEFLVSGNSEECQIYSCLTNITNKYTESLVTAPSYAINTLQPLLIKALALLNAYQLGKKCGETSCTTYLSQITTIANSCGCSCDCLDCSDNTPVQVVGCCGIVAGSDFTIVITSPGGSLTITSNTPVGSNTTTFTIGVSSTWFNSAFDTRIGSTSVNALSDVDTATTAPIPSQALIWNGTKWVPGTLSTNLVELTDVDITGLTNNMMMYYDSTSGTFKFKIVSYALNDLTDVIIATATTGDILRYNGTNWVNVQNLLLSLADVNAGSIADDQSIKWDTGTGKFIPYTPATALTGLTDVDITTAGLAQSDLLMYDIGSGKWINQAKAEFVAIPNVNFTPSYSNTVGGYDTVSIRYDIITGAVTLRGVVSNAFGASTGTILTLPGFFPNNEVPFICTVGLSLGSPTVAGGSISAAGVVSIGWYLNAIGTRVAGWPAGNIDLGQAPTWYV